MQVKVESLSDETIERRGVRAWPVWERGVSRFAWKYDETERCYLIDGQVRIETADGNIEIEAGDFVTFPAGLECTWDIRKPVRKHYTFDEPAGE